MDHIDEHERITRARQLIETCRQHAEALAERLEGAAQALRVHGYVDDTSFDEDVAAVNEEYDTLLTTLQDLAQELSLSVPEDPSLADIEGFVDNVEARWKERQAHDVVNITAERVLSLQITGSDSELLEAAYAEARSLKEHPDSEEATRVQEGAHPLVQLLHLVGDEALAEKELETAEDAVMKAYGRPLLRAIWAGEVAFVEQPAEVVPFESEDTQEAAATTEKREIERRKGVAEPSENEDSEGEPAAESEPAEAGDSTDRVAGAEVTEASQPEDEGTVQEGVASGDTRDEAATEEYAQNGQVQDTAEVDEGAVEEEKVATTEVETLEDIDPAEASDTTGVTDHIWKLLQEHRYGLAYHLAAKAGEERLEGSGFSPALLRIIALGPHLRSYMGELARLLQDDFSALSRQHLEAEDTVNDVALDLYQAGAALRPALHAPHTSAFSALHVTSLPALRDVCEAVAHFSQNGQPLHIEGSSERVRWEEKMEQLRQDVATWWEQAKQRTIKFQAATRVWRLWLETDGLLHPLLEAVVEGATGRREAVERRLHELQDEDVLGDAIDETTQEFGNRRFRIEFGARDAIIRYAREALELVRQWVELSKAEPSEPQDWIAQQSEALRRQVCEQWPAIQKELIDLKGGSDSQRLSGAVSFMRETLQEIVGNLDGTKALEPDEPTAFFLLHTELLRLPEIRISSSMQPATEEGIALQALVDLASSEVDSWVCVFERQCEHENHEATRHILEYIQAYPEEDAELDKLYARREEELAACREKYDRRIQDRLGLIEEAFAQQLFNEEERDAERARLEGLRQELEDWLYFPALQVQLNSVAADIQRRRAERTQHLREYLDSPQFQKTVQKLNRENEPVGDVAYGDHVRQRIETVLDAGNIPVVNEYIDLVSSDQLLPEVDERDRFAAFCSDAVDEVAQQLKDTSDLFKELKRDVRFLAQVEGLQPLLSDQPLDRSSEHSAEEMLTSWLSARRRKRATKTQVEKVVAGLGFDVRQLDVDTTGKETYAEIETVPLERRSLCPVPEYGSAANGRYRILFLWDESSPDDIVSAVQYIRGRVSRGIIVFYFNAMTLRERSAVAQRAVQENLPFLVLDDVLMSILCSEPSPRLPLFFELTLPFSYVKPYRDTAGHTAPEMFYGRRQFQQQLMNPSGPCLIYGGRQLGKTALVRDVERKFNRHPEHKAVYLDLRPEAYGKAHNPDSIWRLLNTTFREKGLFEEEVTGEEGYEAFRNQLGAWLQGEEGRRVLLLLDEADDFLNADRQQQFMECDRLKSLMDNSQRHFKVVFVGLHNVLRFVRSSNHPLAHLGQPICVGPLIGAEEGAEGRALIMEPMKKIGYRFDDETLPLLIGSHTNWYPSLIQLFGQQLVDDLLRRRANRGEQPPYPVTQVDVDKAYRSTKLQDEIRGKFDLTLNLDPRYALLTYIIALGCVRDGSERLREGFPPEEVHQQALYWWERGFRGSQSLADIKALLDELVGLGVLRHVWKQNGQHAGSLSANYTLRNPNVLRLLGTQDDLEYRIMNFDQYAEEPRYSAATFRRVFRVDDLELRAPLTEEQLRRLTTPTDQVVLLLGAEAAGLSHVPTFLQQVAPRVNVHEDIESAEDLLAHVNADRRRGKPVIHYVPCASGWTVEWLEATVDWVERRRSNQLASTILFEADPGKAWDLEQEEAFELLEQHSEQSVLLTLQPWHQEALALWLQEQGIVQREQQRRVEKLTQNWHALIYNLAARVRTGTLSQVLDVIAPLEEDEELLRRLYGVFGLDHDSWLSQLLLRLALLDDGQGCHPDQILSADDEETDVIRALQWANRLSFVLPGRKGRWRLDPAISSVLLENESAA